MSVIFHKCEKCNCFSHCNNNDLVCQTEYFKLQRENEYLKEWRRHSATCQECYEDGYQDGLRNNKKLIEYKQALEEIEGIVKKEIDEDCGNDIYPQECSYCSENHYCFKKQYLDIISKAKGENK